MPKQRVEPLTLQMLTAGNHHWAALHYSVSYSTWILEQVHFSFAWFYLFLAISRLWPYLASASLDFNHRSSCFFLLFSKRTMRKDAIVWCFTNWAILPGVPQIHFLKSFASLCFAFKSRLLTNCSTSRTSFFFPSVTDRLFFVSVLSLQTHSMMVFWNVFLMSLWVVELDVHSTLKLS